MRRSPVFLLALAMAGCGGDGPLPAEPVPGSPTDTLGAVTAWLTTASSPVPQTTPVAGEPELLAVRDAVAGARLIGLGEATYGTHEFQVVVARDRAMAENALWWVGRSAAGQRTILGAHNYHVSRNAGTMGQAIATSLGTAYVAIASDFDAGTFNAATPGSPYFSVQSIPATPAGSYEEGLRTAPYASFFVDLRAASSVPKVAAWLRGPRTMRLIGVGYDPAHPTSYDRSVALSPSFDAVLFITRSTPSTLLPFVAQ